MRILVVLIALAIAGAGSYGLLFAWPLDADAALERPAVGDPMRGAYLARASGCIGCHTDLEGAGKPLAGGHALDTPFGTFYAPNITTDPEFGIGGWTQEAFAAAVRKGVSPQGKPYYPVFPYTFYASLSDQDVADLWAAFQTVAPVPEPAAESELTFPFNLRATLKLWRALYFEDQQFTADSSQSNIWNRGKYLVEGPTHCGACHTPRSFLGGRDLGRRFFGSEDLPGGEKSPAITQQKLLENDWTERSLAYALKTGLAPSGDAFGGAMGEIVAHSTSFLTEDDRNAIAHFLMNQASENR